jgi:hypothetical protein
MFVQSRFRHQRPFEYAAGTLVSAQEMAKEAGPLVEIEIPASADLHDQDDQ